MNKSNLLFTTDLDGTLLGADAKLSSQTVTKINNLIDKGYNFTVATGRSLESTQNLLKDIKLKLPVITNNGALISDINGAHHYKVHCIEPDIVEKIFALGLKYNLNPFFQTYSSEGNKLNFSDPQNKGMEWYINDHILKKDKRLKKYVNIRDHSYNKIIQIFFIDRKERLVELASEMLQSNDRLLFNHFITENPYDKGWYWLDFSSKNASKGIACDFLCQYINLTLKDLVVYGDAMNDVSMFEVAGQSFAMENSVFELKQLATKTIGHAGQETVVNSIYNLLKNP